MDNQFSNIDVVVSDYVKGKLIGQALVEFENQLATNSSLQEKVALEQALFELFVDADTMSLKERMKADFDNGIKDTTTKKWWLGGLGAGVLLIGSVVYFNQQPIPNNEALPPVALEKPTTVIAVDTAIQLIEIEEHTNREIHTLQPVHFEENKEKAVKEVSVISTKEEVAKVDSTQVKKQLPKLIASSVSSEKTTPIQVVDTCVNVAFKGEVKLKKAQKGNDNGEITLDERLISGGQKPYLFSLTNGAFSIQTIFSNLEANQKYSVFVKDDNGCVGLLNNGKVLMTSTECVTDYQATFSISYEQDWLVPTNAFTSARISLTNRVGQIVLNKQLEEGETYRWDGIFENGNKVTPGRYNWMINYQDGEQCVVKMTVIN